jgi:phosphoglycolate phosphatase-like HAD superfamily hydrolase
MRKKVFLLDIDGTLLHSGGAGTRSLTKSFHQIYGIENAFDNIIMDGKTDPEIVKEGIFKNMAKKDITPEEVNRVLREYVAFLEKEIWTSPNYHLLPGVEEMLKELYARDNILLGLATGNIEAGAKIKLKRGGIDKYFRFGGYGSDSEDRGEVIRIAVERAKRLLSEGISGKEDIYVIGDTPRDIIFGRQANTITVGVATGRYSIEELQSYSPDYLLPNLTYYKTLL